MTSVIIHGALKNAFLGQLVTQWIGSVGVLKRLTCQYRGMDPPGKPITAKGTVTRKYQQNGEYLVDCDIWLENAEGRKHYARVGDCGPAVTQLSRPRLVLYSSVSQRSPQSTRRWSGQSVLILPSEGRRVRVLLRRRIELELTIERTGRKIAHYFGKLSTGSDPVEGSAVCDPCGCVCWMTRRPLFKKLQFKSH